MDTGYIKIFVSKFHHHGIFIILGIIGATMKLDKNGDSEGNFSVIAYKETENKTVRYNFSCPFQFRPIGQFFQSDDVDDDPLPVST